MRIVIFCHSLASDWNHGNAHFLRGVASELVARGHRVDVFEPRDAWSAQNLVADAGAAALQGYRSAYPSLASERYETGFNFDAALDGADLVLVHEWNDRDLVARVGRARANGGRFVLLFHDTHHRSISDAAGIASFDLEHYDGVLAFGEAIRQRYLSFGWSSRAWTWHEAADPHVFRPLRADRTGDLVWIGNWGDDERSDELWRFLIDPVRDLGLRARIHGVRYPPPALDALRSAGIEYGGWLPNYRAPEVFAAFGATVHVPRRPYVEALPGVPTIRIFEALACGIPLVSCWWDDCERLFDVGRDFLMVRTADEMRGALRDVLSDPALAAALAEHGRASILARHTCAHRVDQLMGIVDQVRGRRTKDSRYENHDLRPGDHLFVGQRPCDDVPGAGAGAGSTRA